MTRDDGEKIAIREAVRKAHPLTGVLHGPPPHPPVPELFHKVSVELLSYILYGSVPEDNEGLLQIRSLSLGL